LRSGAPKDKIIMGMPSYGNAYTLSSASNNGVGAPAVGAGSLKYFEICQRTKSGSLTYRWDDAQKVPYAFNGNFWIGYDDLRSIIEKSNYVKNNNLGGGMFWALDDDDYNDVCGGGKFPLISAAYRIIVNGGSVPVSTLDRLKILQ
jgi:GH18 family chitinase